MTYIPNINKNTTLDVFVTTITNVLENDKTLSTVQTFDLVMYLNNLVSPEDLEKSENKVYELENELSDLKDEIKQYENLIKKEKSKLIGSLELIIEKLEA